MIKYIGKCLFIEEEKILVVGDLHIGYEESLNSSGVFVSRALFDESIKYFELVLNRIGKLNKVVFLGDVKHGFSRNVAQEWDEIGKLIDFFYKWSDEIIFIRGNHDNYLKNISSKKNVKVEDYLVWKEYCFLHGDRDFEELYDKKITYWMIGHIHPAIRLTDDVKQEKYKCFLEGKYKDKTVIVVPSFHEGNTGTDPRDGIIDIPWKFDLNKFEVSIVSEDLEVLKFGKLGKLK